MCQESYYDAFALRVERFLWSLPFAFLESLGGPYRDFLVIHIMPVLELLLVRIPRVLPILKSLVILEPL